MIKVNDIVWVNEATLFKHQWYGKVLRIHDEIAAVRDTTGGSYHGEVFIRMLSNLENKSGGGEEGCGLK